jgi:phage I-like protein
MTEFNYMICAVDGKLPEWIRLLPLGEVDLVDGRESFTVDRTAMETIVQGFTARGIDLVIDYEHQSLGPERAPAAGWIKELQAREDGLWGRVDWTPQGGEYLKNREYRYFSPVLRLDPETRRPTALLHMGLTNVPAINRLAPLVAKAKTEIQAAKAQKQEAANAMIEKMRQLLGLSGEQGEGEILALAKQRFKLADTASSLPEIALAVGLEDNATPAQIKGAVLALKQGAEQLGTLQGEVAALKAESALGKARGAVDEALKAGKLTPTQQEWAMEYAGRDLEGFKVFVAKAPQVVPVGEAFKLAKETGAGPRSSAPPGWKLPALPRMLRRSAAPRGFLPGTR